MILEETNYINFKMLNLSESTSRDKTLGSENKGWGLNGIRDTFSVKGLGPWDCHKNDTETVAG